MTFYYLATVYTSHPRGQHEAYREACIQSGLLLDARIPTFSPVIYSHPMAIAAELDPLDHDMWMSLCRPFIQFSHGLIMCKMDCWEQSKGMKEEHETFLQAGKPIFWMEPGTIPPELLAPRGRGTIDKDILAL